MSDELDEIFATQIPSVAEGTRSAFFKGIRAYHDIFKAYREESMVYETGEQSNIQGFFHAIFQNH
jgi:hypothetical protein